MPYLGNEPAVAYTSTTKDTFSGDASTTDFTMSKSANVNAVRVVVENVIQDPTVAYTCSGTTLTFTSAPPTGTNNIYVVHLGPPAATVAPPSTINNPTTFTGGVTLKNETPEDTDGGRESIVTFQGTQSGNEITTLAQIQASHDGTSDDEKGDLIFKTNDGNDGASPTERLRLDSIGSLGLGTSIPASSSTGVYLTGGGATYSTGSTYRYDMVNAYFDTSASAWKYIGNGVGTQIYQANGDFVFNNAANNTSGAGASLTWVEAMRLTETAAHGRGLGIGTSAPLRQLHISNTSANSEIAFTAGTSGTSSILFGDGLTGTDIYRGYLQYQHASDAFLFATSATERMRIDSSGRVGINGSVNQFVTPLSVRSTTTSQYVADFAIQTNGYGIYLRNASDSVVGTIIMNASGTVYNTSSDYRLKENVTDVTDGITRVKQLDPKRFNFIAEPDTTVDGFLAHEVQTVVPEAITGTHNEVEVWTDGEELPEGVSVGDNKLDDDGNTIPKYQGIDQSKLVPLLTAALQEAIAKIETLETKVAALEAG